MDELRTNRKEGGKKREQEKKCRNFKEMSEPRSEALSSSRNYWERNYIVSCGDDGVTQRNSCCHIVYVSTTGGVRKNIVTFSFDTTERITIL